MLYPAVLVAALLQSATGVGFGLIAGPFLLLALAPHEALVVASALGLLIAVAVAPLLARHAERNDLRLLALGALAGLAPGTLAFVYADAQLLKGGAALLIVVMLHSLLRQRRAQHTADTDTDTDTAGQAAPVPAPGAGRADRLAGFGAGLSAGALGVCLSMPGPGPAAYLLRLERGKHTIRATILTFFVLAFGAALPLQLAFGEFDPGRLRALLLRLTPLTLVGLLLGQLLTRFIAERAFRWLLIALLGATLANLLGSLFWDPMPGVIR